MAGYRPKSLDELNEMYDKTITAEKAIIKATKHLHDVTETIVPSHLPEDAEKTKEDNSAIEGFSSDVDTLINHFREEAKATAPRETKKADPSVFESLHQTTEEKELMPEIPDAKAFENSIATPAAASKPKLHYSIDAPEEIQQKASAKSDERTDLFNDYMKIMNDEDDDFFSHHDSFKKKDKKKKHKKGLFFRHEPQAEETEDSAEEDDLLIYEDENGISEDIPSEPEEKEEEQQQPTHPDFDIITDADEDLPLVPEEIAGKTFEEFIDDSDDIYSFDPSKKNTIPEYAQEQYSEEADFDGEDDEEDYFSEEESDFVKHKNKKGIVAGRVILSILLSIICVLTVGIAGINTLLNVNTGNATFGEKFIFTAAQDYTNSNILEGDLIITEKRYANDGESFAYINYTQQCFMFGKRNGSIVNDSGDVLFIAENDGERVLVLRDDTRGVVVNTYPEIGNIVTICTEFFIPIIASLLLIALIIILLLTFVFKDKEKAYNKMMKKMVKKGVILADEEIEESETEANLFSTIE